MCDSVDSMYSKLILRSRFGGERDLWVSAINAASDGSKLKQVHYQKQLQTTKFNAREMLQSGKNEEALDTLKQARALTERRFGNGSLEVAHSTIDLLNLHLKLLCNHDNVHVLPLVDIDQTQTGTLIKLCDEALTIFHTQDTQKEIHESKIMKSRLLFLQGHYNDAVMILKSILNGFHRQPDKYRKEIVDVLILMGRCAYGACNLSNASSIFEQALSLALTLHGTVHIDVANICIFCAITCMAQRKFVRVREYLDITSRIYSKLSTKDNDRDIFIRSQRLLGQLSIEVGAFEGAQKFLQVVELATSTDESEPQYAICCELIARLYFEQNNFQSYVW